MRTCDEWWTTTTANPNMFARPKYQTDQVEDHLMMWPDVDAAILAILVAALVAGLLMGLD